jgi:ribosomal protein S18 acetylase RimI-like enzyme
MLKHNKPRTEEDTVANSKSVKIDIYTSEDDKKLIALVTAVLAEHNFKFDQKLDADMYSIGEAYINGGGLFFVAKDGEKVVGCAGVRRISSELAELRRIYLLPEYRGSGMGRMLVEKALNFCREKKHEKVVLDTTERNKAAIALFTKLGFKVVKQEGEKMFFEMRLGGPPAE